MSFNDKAAIQNYAERPARQVPGFADMQKMALILLRERVPADGEVLVVGAGGGLELKVFADAEPGWRFTGVDPSAEMLDLARQVAAPHRDRINLIEGTTEDAPDGPFDGATCLLVMHFLDRATRISTLKAIRSRLKTGAPFVVMNHSVPKDSALTWLQRSVAFGSGPAGTPEQVRTSAAMMVERLPLLAPQEEEALLAEAGFSNVALFYAGFSFRGWVATA